LWLSSSSRYIALNKSCTYRFFDNYIIPLAKKLRECEVFGVACDEFLVYAEENRKEWASKGEGIVKSLVEDQEMHTRGLALAKEMMDQDK
jgi:hypothetical protein